tara:strand:- start:839 stop:1267 length:429 start_codon:yes stop_codon:yes gene_type:complete
MNKKTLYIIFVFAVTPVYLFYEPTISYFSNMKNITYSLEIPINRDINTENIDYEIEEVPNAEERKSLRRSWVLLIQSDDGDQNIALLKKMGLENTIKVKSRIDNKQKEAIGPFLDRQIALDMQKKIKKNTSINVTIQEIVSQ